jgi:hypothetical protein
MRAEGGAPRANGNAPDRHQRPGNCNAHASGVEPARPVLSIKRAPATDHEPPAPAPLPPVALDDGHFFLIWCAASARPRQRHPSLAAALEERDRLASANPGKSFSVFEAKRVDV